MIDQHETDKALWLEAHHHAPAYLLAPGQLLTAEQREYARNEIAANKAADERDRLSD